MTKFTATIKNQVATIEAGNIGTFTADTADQVVIWVLQQGTVGQILFRSGTYLFNAPVTVFNDGVQIVLEAGAVLTPNHTGAIGIFNITGDYCSVSGYGMVKPATWVNDQVLIKFDGGIRPRVKDITFDWTAISGASANYMTGLLVQDCIGEEVRGCAAFPCAGSVPFKSLRMDAGIWEDNSVRPKVARSPTSGGTYNKVYVPYWMQGMQVSKFSGNTAYGLGGTGSDRIPYVLLIQWDADRDGEQGHNVISENRFSACYANRWIAHYGGHFNSIVDNMMCQNEGVADTFAYLNAPATNHAAIHIDSSDHTTNGHGSIHTMIERNDIHNFGGTAVPQVYAARSQRLYIKNNNFGIVNAVAPVAAVSIDGDTCLNDIEITGNHFDGSGQDRAVYIFQTTTIVQAMNRWVIANNTANQFLRAFEPVLGVYGPGDPFGLGFDDSLEIVASTIAFESIATAGGGFPKIVDSGSGLADILEGYYIQITGGSLQNSGIAKVHSSAAGELELELEQISAVTINDFADAAEGTEITIKVYKPGFTTNVAFL